MRSESEIGNPIIWRNRRVSIPRSLKLLNIPSYNGSKKEKKGMKMNAINEMCTLGCSSPILEDVLNTSTWTLSFVGGSSTINWNSSSHLGSLLFFTRWINPKHNCQFRTRNQNVWQLTRMQSSDKIWYRDGPFRQI